MGDNQEQLFEKKEEKSSENLNRTQRSPNPPDLHELLATATPAERARAEMERLMNSYSDDPDAPNKAPPKSEESHLAPEVKLYSDELGRNHIIDEVQSQGSFYVKPDPKIVVAFSVGLMIPGVALAIIALVVINNVLSVFAADTSRVFNTILIVEIVILVAAALFIVYQCITKIRGPLHSYKADGRAFYVSVKGLNREQIMFKDVRSVNYVPTKFLWGVRGYKVDIFTTYGVIHYDYIFPTFNQNVSVKYLPFEVLRKNIPKKDPEKQE